MSCSATECKCGCNQNPYSELEPVLEKYGNVKGSLITILQKNPGHLRIHSGGCHQLHC